MSDRARPACSSCARHPAVAGLRLCLNCKENAWRDARQKDREAGRQRHAQDERDRRRGG